MKSLFSLFFNKLQFTSVSTTRNRPKCIFRVIFSMPLLQMIFCPYWISFFLCHVHPGEIDRERCVAQSSFFTIILQSTHLWGEDVAREVRRQEIQPHALKGESFQREIFLDYRLSPCIWSSIHRRTWWIDMTDSCSDD